MLAVQWVQHGLRFFAMDYWKFFISYGGRYPIHKTQLRWIEVDNLFVFFPGTLSFLFKVSFIINEGVTATILQLLTTALCENDSQKDSETPGSVYQVLVQQLTQSVDIEAVRQFVRCFLLQSNSTSIRWQAHSLLYSVHRYVCKTHVTIHIELRHEHFRTDRITV